VTATGAYYWTFLIRSFAYLDLVLVDTPLREENLAKDLASLAEKTKEELGTRDLIQIRISRVRKFLRYLIELESAELAISARQGGPYHASLGADINEQIEKEIAVLK